MKIEGDNDDSELRCVKLFDEGQNSKPDFISVTFAPFCKSDKHMLSDV